MTDQIQKLNPPEGIESSNKAIREAINALIDAYNALEKRVEELEKPYRIIGGQVSTICCDAPIREDGKGELWCVNCGKNMGKVERRTP